MTEFTQFLALLIYIALGLLALWGAFSVVMVWRRVAQIRFRDEAQQDELLEQVEEPLRRGDMEAAAELCQDDARALPQLVILATDNHALPLGKLRTLLAERFRRDVLADLDYRISWIDTIIKSAPMVGLFGTVIGMMGAFGKLASQQQENVTPSVLANDISLALITTACGLAIAIPLVLARASVMVRIRQMEDLIGSGLARLLEALRPAAKESA
jgi:biopolymer transport protein ExbB/TolQ